MRFKGHVARIVGRRDAYRILVGKSEGSRPPEDEGADGNVMLKWVFKKEAWGRGLHRGCTGAASICCRRGTDGCLS